MTAIAGWTVGYFARQRRKRQQFSGAAYAFLNDKTLNLRDELEEHYKKLDISPKEFIEKYEEYEKKWLQLYNEDYAYIYAIHLKKEDLKK